MLIIACEVFEAEIQNLFCGYFAETIRGFVATTNDIKSTIMIKLH
jgi:hypothetical protein